MSGGNNDGADVLNILLHPRLNLGAVVLRAGGKGIATRAGGV